MDREENLETERVSARKGAVNDPYLDYCEFCKQRHTLPLCREDFEEKYWEALGAKAKTGLARFLEDYHPRNASVESAFEDYTRWSTSGGDWPLPVKDFAAAYEARRVGEARRSFEYYLENVIAGRAQKPALAEAYTDYCSWVRQTGLWPMAQREFENAYKSHRKDLAKPACEEFFQTFVPRSVEEVEADAAYRCYLDWCSLRQHWTVDSREFARYFAEASQRSGCEKTYEEFLEVAGSDGLGRVPPYRDYLAWCLKQGKWPLVSQGYRACREKTAIHYAVRDCQAYLREPVAIPSYASYCSWCHSLGKYVLQEKDFGLVLNPPEVYVLGVVGSARPKCFFCNGTGKTPIDEKHRYVGRGTMRDPWTGNYYNIPLMVPRGATEPCSSCGGTGLAKDPVKQYGPVPSGHHEIPWSRLSAPVNLGE